MNRRKVLVLVMFVGLIAFASSVLARGHVFAEQERPLAEMALQKSELPEGTKILSAGPTVFNDVSQPINSANSANFRVHEFLEVYRLNTVGKQVNAGHYLYRYRDVTQAEEQARVLVTYALQDKESQRLQPLLINNGAAAESSSGKGQVIRFINPEIGAVYYWFIGVKGRTLMLLVVGGPLNEPTKTTFESLKARVQQR